MYASICWILKKDLFWYIYYALLVVLHTCICWKIYLSFVCKVWNSILSFSSFEKRFGYMDPTSSHLTCSELPPLREEAITLNNIGEIEGHTSALLKEKEDCMSQSIKDTLFKAVENLNKGHILNLRSRRKDIEGVIDIAQIRLDKLVRELCAVEYNIDKAIEVCKFVKETEILNVDCIEQISINAGNNLEIHTKVINVPMTVGWSDEPVGIPVGKFIITMQIPVNTHTGATEHLRIFVKNITTPYVSGGYTYDHPHIRGSVVCWGGISSEMSKLQQTGDIMRILNWTIYSLHNYSPDGAWKQLTNWFQFMPEADRLCDNCAYPIQEKNRHKCKCSSSTTRPVTVAAVATAPVAPVPAPEPAPTDALADHPRYVSTAETITRLQNAVNTINSNQNNPIPIPF